MNGIWTDYKYGGAESIAPVYEFSVVGDGDARKLIIYWSEHDRDEERSTFKGTYWDIDAIMSDIKQAIKNGDKLVEIDLEKYELRDRGRIFREMDN